MLKLRPARLILHLANAYLIAVLVVWLAEPHLMYWASPRRALPAAAGIKSASERILVMPDGVRLVAWEVPPAPGRPTLLYLHGNGAPLTYRADRVKHFQAAGYGVLMLAWRGYSGSGGRPSEAANRSDAKYVYDTMVREGLSAQEIVLYGESMGASVALQVAAERPVLGLVLEAPFTSMVDAWRQFVPFLPVKTLLRDRYDSMAVIGRVTAPILVLHGARDWLVSVAQGRALYQAALGPKRLEVFPEGNHVNLYDQGAMAVVRRFIDELRSKNFCEQC